VYHVEDEVESENVSSNIGVLGKFYTESASSESQSSTQLIND